MRCRCGQEPHHPQRIMLCQLQLGSLDSFSCSLPRSDPRLLQSRAGQISVWEITPARRSPFPKNKRRRGGVSEAGRETPPTAGRAGKSWRVAICSRAIGDEEPGGRGGGVAATVDAGAGEPGVGAGEGGRGPAAGRLPGGGCGVRRVADGAGLAHPLPRARPGRVLPARRLRLRAPRPGARNRCRRLSLGRGDLPRRRLRQLPPDGDLAGAERHRARAGRPGHQLARRRLHRRPHARRRVRVAADDLQPGLDPGGLLRRAAGARHVPRRGRVAPRVPRRGGGERRAGRAHVALRRRPARQVQDGGRGGGGGQGAAPGREARPLGAHVPDHRRAGDRGVRPVVRAQLRRHVAGARWVHALGDQRHHGAVPVRHRSRRALRRAHRGPCREAVPRHRQDRAGADKLRVSAPARRHPAAGVAQRHFHRRRARRRVFHHGILHILERLVDQQPYFRRDRAREGEDDGLRTGQMLRSSVRLLRATHRRRSSRARVRLQTGLVGHERRHGQRERRCAGQGDLHGDRRAHGHLLLDVHLPLPHLPPGQSARTEGPSDGVRRGAAE